MPDNRIRLEKYSQPDNRAKPGTTCDESNAHWKISKCQEKKILFFFLSTHLHMLVLGLWIVLMHIKAL